MLLLCLLCSTAAPCKYSLKSPRFCLLVRQGWHPIASWRDGRHVLPSWTTSRDPEEAWDIEMEKPAATHGKHQCPNASSDRMHFNIQSRCA